MIGGFQNKINARAHDPEKWEPVSRLREARFGGRRKVGKDHAQTKEREAVADSTKTHQALAVC